MEIDSSTESYFHLLLNYKIVNYCIYFQYMLFLTYNWKSDSICFGGLAKEVVL